MGCVSCMLLEVAIVWMIGWIKNQPTMCAPKQSKWCVVSEAVVLSPKLQWCGWLRTHPFLLRNGVAALLLFSIWMAPFLLQNGAAAPLYTLKHPLSLVWLSISPQMAASNPLKKKCSLLLFHFPIESSFQKTPFLFFIKL